MKENDRHSDEALLEEFKTGSHEAFEALYERHKRPLLAFIMRSTMNREAAEDLLQEVFIKVINNARSYKPRAKFTTWLYTIARNACIDRARSASVKVKNVSLSNPAYNAEGSPSLDQTIPDHSPSQEEEMDTRERAAVVESALENLPEEQREVFVLKEFSGLTFEQIARATSANLSTVKSRMRYAIKSISLRARESLSAVHAGEGGA